MSTEMTIGELLTNYWYLPFYGIIWIAYYGLRYLKSIDNKLTILHTDNEVQNTKLETHEKWISKIEQDLKDCKGCDHLIKKD